MSNTPLVLSEEGLNNLKEELSYLKTVKRNEIAEKIKEARDFGDLSENSEYDAALNEQAIMEARITYIENQLEKAIVLEHSELDSDTVQIGTIVRVLDCEFKEEVEYSIVSITESDPAKNRISDQSPVGKAFLGKRVGDSVLVEAPGGEFSYKILEIRLPD